MGVSSGLSESDLSKSRCTKAFNAQHSILPLQGFCFSRMLQGSVGRCFVKGGILMDPSGIPGL